MFDLEKSIAEWRKQMLDAGIQSPMPLDELESHLREDIEKHVGSGEDEGFHAAILKFGKPRLIQNEFKKAGTGGGILRPFILIFGWLAASCMLLYCMAGLEFDWNFFNFSTRWNRGAVVDILGIVVASATLWFLAKAGCDKISRAVMLLVAVLMAGLVIETFPPEKVPNPAPLVLKPGEDPMHAMVGAAIHRAFQRHEPSPLWFRGGQSLLVCLPVIVWIGRERRRKISNNQYV
jgi:hypothetical protein